MNHVRGVQSIDILLHTREILANETLADHATCSRQTKLL
jgi:hypothetical protein